MATAHKVRILGSKSEYDEAIKAEHLTVVDLYADWCGPCRFIAPHLEKLAAENPEVSFCKVNVDNVPFPDVRAIPLIRFFKAGALVGVVEGADVAAIASKVKELQ